jgi:hypothetical protein
MAFSWRQLVGVVLLGCAGSVPALTPQEVYQHAANSTVVIRTESGLGSGVLVSPYLVATNCHVTKSDESVKVFFMHQTTGLQVTATGTVVGRNEPHDVCAVGIEQAFPGSRPVGGIRSWASVKVGDPVYTLGAPIGLAYSFSDGIVSQKRESNGGKLVQFTAPISPGNSGGGLFDANGKLIGLTSLASSPAGKAQNLNFAWSVDDFPEPLASALKLPSGPQAKDLSTTPGERPVSARTTPLQYVASGWGETWRISFAQGDYRRALASATSWTTESPDKADAWVARGRSAERITPGSGFEFFKRALVCNHSHQDAMYYGALSAHRLGNSHDFRRMENLLRKASPRRADDLAAQVAGSGSQRQR